MPDEGFLPEGFIPNVSEEWVATTRGWRIHRFPMYVPLVGDADIKSNVCATPDSSVLGMDHSG